MQTAWSHWVNGIAKKLSDQLGLSVAPEELVVPPDANLGDLSFSCFRLAKEKKMNPAEAAKQIAAEFVFKNTDIEKVAAAGPYVNFTFLTGDAVNRVVRDVEQSGEEYGDPAVREGRGRELLLEYAQPNTHKEIHVGHLRNLVLGSSLWKILETAGWKVIPMSYHGDVGAHVAKCLWRLVKIQNPKSKNLTEKEAEEILKKIPKNKRNGKFLGQIYTEASRELEEKPELKDEISLVQQKLEARDKAWEKLWRETRRWSLEEMAGIFDELGVKIERQYLESEVVERGQEIVDVLIKKNIAKESQGAIIVDLEDKKLGVFLVRKTDGTSLYSTKDLALAELKAKEYPKYARSLMVIDNRQSLYFKQLSETLKMMGFDKPMEFVGYELVTLKTGAMSSREGNIVTYESFRDEVLARAKQEILKRHDDWSQGQVAETAWKIAMGGIKFGMLKQDSEKIFTFDLEQSLSFEGATGPYCQYAATRLGSIIKKSKDLKIKKTSALTREFDQPSEKALALALAKFPDRVAQAAKELRPSIIGQWCFETAQKINDFYRDVPVLESKKELLDGRLRLTAAARLVLARGLALLGISVPEQM